MDASDSEHTHTLACGCTATLAPGWAALEATLAAHHDGRDPIYFSTEEIDDGCPIESVAVHQVDSPTPYWLFMSCGLSELYHKQFISPEVSGYGFELTLRTPKRDEEDEAPSWPFQLLRNLGRYVAIAQQPFREGEHMNAMAPLALDEPCTLTALCFVEDPLLAAIATPNGSVRFMQVLGLTEDELEVVMDGDPLDFIAAVAQRNPLFLCPAARDSYLLDEEMARALKERIDSDGSTASGGFVDDLAHEETKGELRITLGALHVRALVRGLFHRVTHERDYVLRGPRSEVLLAPSRDTGWHLDESRATLMLTPDDARALGAALAPRRGTYRTKGVERVVVVVEATELRDNEGNVLEVIG